jgi:thioredoxin reductase
VLIIDSQKPANRFSHAAHNFFTRDGMPPAELLSIGREQLRAYDTVKIQQGEVTHIAPDQQGFSVTLADGSRQSARKVLLAMGLKDTLPAIPGLQELWGTSVLHCPYCDGWEQRDKPVAIYGKGEQALHVAKLMRVLTDDLVICSGGPSEFTSEQKALLSKHSIRLIETPVERVEGHDGQLERIIFTDGTTLDRQALFVRPVVSQHSDLAAQLGCELTENGLVKIDLQGRASIAGIYAAGDISHPMRQVGIAAAQGAMAGAGINTDLVAEDFAE